MDDPNTKKTALYDIHAALGAKLIPFAGYWMPVQYPAGIIAEHRRVRTTVGIFDVSHMGEFEFHGPDAEKFLNYLTINDVSKLAVGQVQYSAMCYPDGGMVDDLLVYRFKDHYFMVVNAANLPKDRDWVLQHLPKQGVDFKDISDDITLLAVQGSRSLDLMKSLVSVDLAPLQYYHFCEGKVAGINAIISRTGYTGELGFEIYINCKHSEVLWNKLFEVGKAYDVEPIGLGARDTLRLEMKYCLYGNDIDQTTHPLEADLGWITRLNKGDFVGRDVIAKAREAGITRKLVGFEVSDRSVPRHGYPLVKNGKQIGITTSGNHSAMLGKGIGMGYVPIELSAIGTELELDQRGSLHPIKIVATPFYQPQKIN